MNRALATPPLLRLVRSGRLWLAIAGGTAVALAFALSARSGGATSGASHALLGVTGPFVLPLMTYGIVGSALGTRSLQASLEPLVRFGASRVEAALAEIGVALVACVVVAAALAASVALVAHGSDDPPRALDALTSAYAAALGGAAYAAWFAFGAAFGRRGGGRTALLLVDALCGAQTGAAALFVPRGHLRNLLGGAPPLHLPERASAGALVLLTILLTAAAVRRARR